MELFPLLSICDEIQESWDYIMEPSVGSTLVTSCPRVGVCACEHIHGPRSATSLLTYNWAAESPFFFHQTISGYLEVFRY